MVVEGRFVMQDRVIPGVDDRALRREMQAQFDGLVAQYPRRTFGHPPVENIFSSSYPRIERPQ